MNLVSVEPYARIDYYSVVLNDCAIGSIFDKFNISYSSGSDLEFSMSEATFMHLRQVMYRVPFFRLTVSLAEHPVDVNVFNHDYSSLAPSERASIFTNVYSSVKLEAAGAELNELRKAGFDVEAICMDSSFWLRDCAKEFKITRCDFAFDFIDHPTDPGFAVNLSKYLSKQQSLDNLRLCTANNLPSGMIYKVERSPSGCCSYLGSQKSPEFLRVYDKLQEQAEKVYGTYDTASWGDSCEFSGCQSWTRIELQCRRQKAVKLLFREGSVKEKLMYILKYIFNHYMICGPDHELEPFIRDYFDVSTIQNLNFVQFEELEKYKISNTVTKQVDNWLERNHAILWAILNAYGVDYVIDFLNNKRKVCYESIEPVPKLQLFNQNKKLSELCLALGLSLHELPYSYVDLYKRRFLVNSHHLAINLLNVEAEKSQRAAELRSFLKDIGFGGSDDE